MDYSKEQLKPIEKNTIGPSITQTPTRKRRDSGIEILRYLLMLTIIFLHMSQSVGSWWCTIGVPCFFMITGWFSVYSTKSRFLKFLSQFIVYFCLGIIIQSIFYYGYQIGQSPFYMMFSFRYLSDSIASWWFIYIMLFLTLVGPYLNRFIQWNKMYSFWFLVFCIAFLNWWNKWGNTTAMHQMFTAWKALLAISFYCSAGWVSYYCKDRILSAQSYNKIAVFIICSVIIIGYFFIEANLTHILNWLNHEFKTSGEDFWGINTQSNDACVLHYVCGICLIIFFCLLPSFIQKNRILPFLGKLPLFIYLFHGLVIESIQKHWPSLDMNTHFSMFYFQVVWITTFASILFAYPIQWSSDYVYKVIINKRLLVPNWVVWTRNKLRK